MYETTHSSYFLKFFSILYIILAGCEKGKYAKKCAIGQYLR